MKTYSPKPDHIERRWYVLDAAEQVLGRVASEAAVILRGKHKPIYAPHMDVGDHVIIVNAAKVVLTGGKEGKKVAWRHSGHPGGITGTLYADLLAKRPTYAVEKAVRGMLPKNRLGRAMIRKLHVLAGGEHPHAAQKPIDWAMGQRPGWGGLPTPAPASANGAKRPEDGSTQQVQAEERSAGTPAPRTTTTKTTSTKKATAARKPAAKEASAKKPSAKEAAAKKPAARKTTASKGASAAKATGSAGTKKTTRTSTARKTSEKES